MKKNKKELDIYSEIDKTESLCCTPGTNTVL